MDLLAWFRRRSDSGVKPHTYITDNGRMVTPVEVYMNLPEVQAKLARIREMEFYKELVNRHR